MATLGGTDLGDVQSESHTKSSSLFNQPLPGSDSDNAILLDLFGMSRSIAIEGIITDITANLRTFISTMEGFASGAQSGLAFVSSLVTSPASYNTFIEGFSWTFSAGNPGQLNYTLNLIEGEDIA